MQFFKKFIILIAISTLISSCGSFNPFNSTIETTSDGSYVIETGMTDSELLSYGQIVIYRYKSVPNMVAVKSTNIGKGNHKYIYDKNIYSIPENNKKVREEIKINTLSKTQIFGCSQAYCEARFNEVYNDLKVKNISLNAVDIAIVDSGVVPVTSSIKNALASSSNISGNTNIINWSSHATYIASLLVGYKDSYDNNFYDIYAENARIHSVKISFASDNEDPDKRKYGSMQLSVALDEAVSLGSKIVNLSFAYSQKPDDNVVMAEKIVMAYAAKSGVIFVCAAGNDGNKLDSFPVYPASYDINNIITVGSHNTDLNRAISSNYGKSVDLTAQGALIDLNNKYGEVDTVGGTSFAAPLVVAALSIYYGITPNSNVNTTLKQLFSSANMNYNFYESQTIAHYGRVDVKKLYDIALLNH
ncbi:S8 family peptidase [Fluviispira multicolorata]|nr:S8/S53 family peptidase [Fluviispira multicolorata]